MKSFGKSNQDIIVVMDKLFMLQPLKYPVKKRIIVPFNGHNKIFAFAYYENLDIQIRYNKTFKSRTILRITLPASFMFTHKLETKPCESKRTSKIEIEKNRNYDLEFLLVGECRKIFYNNRLTAIQKGHWLERHAAKDKKCQIVARFYLPLTISILEEAKEPLSQKQLELNI